jgi:hypothetical protein
MLPPIIARPPVRDNYGSDVVPLTLPAAVRLPSAHSGGGHSRYLC